MSALLVGYASPEPCGAWVIGDGDHRCIKPATGIRDGLLVCGTHAKAAGVWWAGRHREPTIVEPEHPIDPKLEEWRAVIRGGAERDRRQP